MTENEILESINETEENSVEQIADDSGVGALTIAVAGAAVVGVCTGIYYAYKGIKLVWGYGKDKIHELKNGKDKNSSEDDSEESIFEEE